MQGLKFLRVNLTRSLNRKVFTNINRSRESILPFFFLSLSYIYHPTVCIKDFWSMGNYSESNLFTCVEELVPLHLAADVFLANLKRVYFSLATKRRATVEHNGQTYFKAITESKSLFKI